MGLTKPTAAMINFSIHNVTDPLVRINSGQTGTNDKDIGFVFERGDDANVALFWDETADQFVLVNTTEDGSTNGDVTISSYANLQVGTINTATLEIGGTAVTSTATELNLLDGVTGTLVTEAGTQTLTNKTLTAPVISSITNTGTLTLPTTTGTVALTSDIPTAVSELTNDSGYSTTTGTVTSVAGTGTVNGLSLSGTVTSSGSLTLGGTFSATVSEISDLTATAAELNTLDGITATVTELNYADGVTSNIQTQLDAKLASASYTASDVLTKIKTVDGTGSGLDADLLDGNEATAFALLSGATFTGAVSGTSLTLSGDLTVNGTTTTVNTTNTVVSDNLIELNNGVASNANDSGIVIERGSTGDNAIFAWDESADVFVMGTTTATGASTGDLTIATGELRLDTLRIDQSGTGLRMTNVGAFDNDGSDNFRIFATNDLQLKANGDSGGGLSIDATNNDVTIDNDLRVSAGQFYYGGTAVTSTAAELNILDGVTATTAELNYSDGVTSNIQTQLDAKAPTAGPTFTGTDGIVIPSGTTAQRPVSPATGTMRFNTTDGRFEGYNGTAWVPIDTLYS